MFLAIQEYTIKYIQETLKNLLKGDTKAKKIKKGHSNVSDSLTRTNAANSLGTFKENYKFSLSFSNSNPITLTFSILFLGRPAHNYQPLLANPLVFNQRIGSSYVETNPPPAYGRLSFSASILNGSTLMWQEKTPMMGLLDLSQMIV